VVGDVDGVVDCMLLWVMGLLLPPSLGIWLLEVHIWRHLLLTEGVSKVLLEILEAIEEV